MLCGANSSGSGWNIVVSRRLMTEAAARDVLSGGGEMGALMRTIDWSKTAVGPVDRWPQSFRTALRIVLDTGFPMCIAWGPQFTQFYNDEYRAILGSTKHPGAMGNSARETFAEIWSVIGPMFEKVMHGASVSRTDFEIPLERHGFPEECYFVVSYSPIRSEAGDVGGVLLAITETTERVIGARRLVTLRDLAATPQNASAKAVCEVAAGVVAKNPADVPFALFYLFDTEGNPSLAAAARISTNALSVDRNEAGAPWPLATIGATKGGVVGDCPAGIAVESTSRGSTAPVRTFALPIVAPGCDKPSGVLVAGLSPRLVFDAQYRSFLELVAGHLGSAIASARAQELSRLLAATDSNERQFRELVENLPDLAWTARADGYVDYFNRRWYEYTGTVFEQVSGWGWKSVHDPEMVDEVVERWKRSIATGQPFEMEYSLRGADGQYRWFLSRVRPFHDAEGRVARWFGSNTNIDERRRNEDFKETFLGVLGHDLRNPLNTILTTVRVLCMRGNIDADTVKRLERVIASGVRMQRMIEQLLDVTRARLAGGIPIELSPTAVPLAPLVTKIVDEIRAAHPSAKIELLVDGGCAARVDTDRFEQVVSNLIDNAVAHGDVTRPILVVLSCRKGEVTLSIENHGAPIPREFIPLLFNPFARVEKPAGRSAGLGLGLYISERIMDAHGGKLSVDSSAELGTRFVITLPADR